MLCSFPRRLRSSGNHGWKADVAPMSKDGPDIPVRAVSILKLSSYAN